MLKEEPKGFFSQLAKLESTHQAGVAKEKVKSLARRLMRRLIWERSER